MAGVDDLVARSGDLKRGLVAFAQQPRFQREIARAALARGFDPQEAEDHETIGFLDFFVLQHRLAGGRTVVERFVDSRADLAEDERQMLLGWRDVVDGAFEVQGRDGDALVTANIIDELIYRVRSNMGPGIFRRMRRRSFLAARLVPVGNEWLISGTCKLLPARERDSVYRIAATTAARYPHLVLRNPASLARGWELQRAERDRFVRFFGSDLVVLPGDQVAARLAEFQRFSRREVLDSLPAQRRKQQSTPPPAVRLDLNPDLLDAQTVAVIYDEVEGMNLYAEFGLVEAVFADPALCRTRFKRQVLEYLDDDSVSPLPFRRLAERDPDKASTVFAKLLRRPGFDWRRDGEALMRQRKVASSTNRSCRRSPRSANGSCRTLAMADSAPGIRGPATAPMTAATTAQYCGCTTPCDQRG
jgi:hypothetical protein